MSSPLVFVPGLLCTKELYHHQIAYFSEKAPLSVAHTTQHDTLSAMAQSILETAPPRFSLIGLSMGGYLSLELIRQAPERIERLMLIDTSSRADTLEQTQKRRDFIRLSGMGKFKGVTPSMMSQLIHPDHLLNKEITSVVYQMSKDVGREAFIRQQTAIIGRVDSRPFLPEIKCPTFIVCGQDDQMTPPELSHEMHQLIPHSSLHLVEQSGHLTPLEQPSLVNKLIEKWLTL
jgi:pimeloyl-ACP methyl ester carboxylesterase